MKINLKNKCRVKKNQYSGSIYSTDFHSWATIKIQYLNRPEVIKDIQKVLAKHYNLETTLYHKKKGKKNQLLTKEVNIK